MNATVRKWVVITGTTLAIVVGCNPTVTPVGDTGTSTDGLAVSDGDFSDAPVSPGGTGGVVDVGGDVGVIDEVVITEDGGEETRSFFTAFQIDPVSEDTAGPKFVAAGDIDQDGLLDLVSAWNQSQPLQLHLQRRDPDGNISFRTITLAGTSPIAVVAGLEVEQINDDGWLDIVVLVKATRGVTLCPTDPPTEISRLEGEIIILFSPGDADLIPDGDRWTEMILV